MGSNPWLQQGQRGNSVSNILVKYLLIPANPHWLPEKETCLPVRVLRQAGCHCDGETHVTSSKLDEPPRLSGASCTRQAQGNLFPNFLLQLQLHCYCITGLWSKFSPTHFSPSAKVRPDPLTCCFAPDLCLFHSYVVFLSWCL